MLPAQPLFLLGPQDDVIGRQQPADVQALAAWYAAQPGFAPGGPR